MKKLISFLKMFFRVGIVQPLPQGMVPDAAADFGLIALLGNSGNTDAPHLHFHVMDGTSPLDANGLPYVFTRFSVQGTLDETSGEAMFAAGRSGIVQPGRLDGPHANQLPLNNEVVDFPE